MKIFIQLKRECLDYWNLIHGDKAFNKILWLRLDSRSNLVIKICNIPGETPLYPPILSTINNSITCILLCYMQKVIVFVSNLIAL